MKIVAWTPRPSETELEADGRGVHPTVLQQAVKRRGSSASYPAGENFPGHDDFFATPRAPPARLNSGCQSERRSKKGRASYLPWEPDTA